MAQLFVFEGGECAGKTTIIKGVEKALEEKGYKVISFREPGGCKTSEVIRETIMQNPMSKLTEAYLFAAARAEFVHTKLAPALKEDVIILLDRFYYSSLVYQGIAGEIGYDVVYELNKPFINAIKPTKWFFVDVRVDTQLKRMGERGIQNRLDVRSEYELSVINGAYHSLVNDLGGCLIDGNGSPDEVVKNVMRKVEKCLKKSQIEKNIDDQRWAVSRVKDGEKIC